MKKTITIIILIIICLGLGGYIAYDKLYAKEEIKGTEETTKKADPKDAVTVNTMTYTETDAAGGIKTVEYPKFENNNVDMEELNSVTQETAMLLLNLTKKSPSNDGENIKVGYRYAIKNNILVVSIFYPEWYKDGNSYILSKVYDLKTNKIIEPTMYEFAKLMDITDYTDDELKNADPDCSRYYVNEENNVSIFLADGQCA